MSNWKFSLIFPLRDFASDTQNETILRLFFFFFFFARPINLSASVRALACSCVMWESLVFQTAVLFLGGLLLPSGGPPWRVLALWEPGQSPAERTLRLRRLTAHWSRGPRRSARLPQSCAAHRWPDRSLPSCALHFSPVNQEDPSSLRWLDAATRSCILSGFLKRTAAYDAAFCLHWITKTVPIKVPGQIFFLFFHDLNSPDLWKTPADVNRAEGSGRGSCPLLA